MRWFEWLHQAGFAAGEVLASKKGSPIVRALGWASEIADQPQLVTICVATAAVGVLADDERLTRAGVGMLAAELIATEIKGLIKQRVDRTRPYAPDKGGRYRFAPGDDQSSRMNSFPSGHTAGAIAVAGVIAQTYPQRRAAAYTLAAAIAGVQLPRGKHYPADLAVGAVIGALAGMVANYLVGPGVGSAPGDAEPA